MAKKHSQAKPDISSPENINWDEFHPKLANMFKGKESKMRMIDDWILMETLGMGGYSKVKLGYHKSTAEKAALKIMFADHNGKMSASKKKQLIRELNVMKKVSHVNVIKLISFNEEAQYPEASGKTTPCIMTALEYASGGELFDYLMYTGHFDDASSRTYFIQLIDGLQCMHRAGIAHRDLKPENLLMDSSFTLKIADFGFATEFVDSKGQEHLMKTPCGTKNYLAPEFWKGQKYSYKCDIFACGIILFTMYAGFPPFMQAEPNDWWWDKYSIAIDKLNKVDAIKEKYKGKEESMPENESKTIESCLAEVKKRMSLFWRAHSKKMKFDDDDFKDIALNLIHPDPDVRMDLEEIRKHQWIVKGPVYSAKQLQMYLKNRAKAALQGKARKIREMMAKDNKPQIDPKHKYVRGDGDDSLTPLQKRAVYLDPKDDFQKNVQSVTDELFISSMFQFFTYVPPRVMAARIEKTATQFGNRINISPSENLITVEANLMQKDVLMSGGKKQDVTKKVTFCVKQYLVPSGGSGSSSNDDDDDENEKDSTLMTKPPLTRAKSTSYEQRYLVSFKRLRGDYEAYATIINDMYYNSKHVYQAMNWDGVSIDAEKTEKDDDQKSSE